MNQVMKNGRLVDRQKIDPPEGPGLIYEVIRIMEGTPLFFNEHYERFRKTAEFQNSPNIPARDNFRSMTDDFLGSMEKKDFNIKITFDRDTGDLYIFENPSSYPAQDLYLQGIHTELMVYQRENPNAKIINSDLTSMANKLREKTGAYEILLVDPLGFITEGSRSNVFFVQGDVLYTPPLERVLPGVTRQLIMETCRQMKISVVEKTINSEKLPHYEGAFISGTSPKILPIRSIGIQKLRSVELDLLQHLMGKFDEIIQRNLEEYRNS